VKILYLIFADMTTSRPDAAHTENPEKRRATPTVTKREIQKSARNQADSEIANQHSVTSFKLWENGEGSPQIRLHKICLGTLDTYHFVKNHVIAV